MIFINPPSQPGITRWSLCCLNQLANSQSATVANGISSSARGSKPLEVIGTYNPIPKRQVALYNENKETRPYKEIALDRTRAQYWLGVGAQPSDPVWKLMSMVRGFASGLALNGCRRDGTSVMAVYE